MDPLDWQKIRENLPYILDNLRTNELMYHLYAKNVMTDADMDLVKTAQLSQDKNWEILNILKRKPNGYNVFKLCLEATNQDHITKKLEGPGQKLNTDNEPSRRLCTKTAKVLSKSKQIRGHQYQGDNGQTKTQTYFDIVGADARNGFNIRCFNIKQFDFVYEGLTYEFIDLIKAGDEFWVNYNTIINCSAQIDIPVKVVNAAPILPEEAPEYGVQRQLAKALSWHGAMSLIRGKIVAVSRLRNPCPQNDQLCVLSLYLKDCSGCAKVSLFGENASIRFKENEHVQISHVYKKEYRGKPYLSTTKDSICQIIDDDELGQLKVYENDFPDDEEFDDDENRRQNVSVHKIHKVHIYPSCQKKGCSKKKVTDNCCPKCGNSDIGLSCVAKLIFCFESAIQLIFSVFQDDLRTILDTNIDMSSKEALMRQLSAKFPLKFSCVINGDKIRNIQVKRPLE